MIFVIFFILFVYNEQTSRKNKVRPPLSEKYNASWHFELVWTLKVEIKLCKLLNTMNMKDSDEFSCF